jgi:hypothetical protein
MRLRVWPWLLVVVASAACDDFRSPADLKYPQVLAVRLTPPQLLPGQRARVDVLVTDTAGVPSVVRPASVDFAPDPISGKALSLPQEASGFLEHDGDDFFARAPDETTLDQIATATGLAADAALKVPLRVTVDIEGEARRADKLVIVLRPASGVAPTPNPMIEEIQVDGQPVSADASAPPVDVAVVAEHQLAVRASEGGGALTYAWFTAVGEMKHYRAAASTLTVVPEKAGDGAALVVVRNDRGGVAWQWFALHAH